jgi:hypothetical protein
MNSVCYRAKVPSAILGGTADAAVETQFHDAAGTRLQLFIGAEKVDAIPFNVRLAGRVTGGTTVNFTLNLDYGTSATYTSNTTMATSGAVAVNSASSNFFLDVWLMWDSTSLILQGCSGNGWMGTTPTIHTKAVTTAATAIAATTVLTFTATGLFSSSNASNAAYLTQFDLLV